MGRAMTAVLAALFVVALVPAVAGAATVEVNQQGSRAMLVFEAAASEANALTVNLASQDPDGNRYTVRDTGATVTPGTGCAGGGSPGTLVTCLVPRSRPAMAPNDFGLRVTLSFALGDGNNGFDSTTLPAQDGGGGDFDLEVTAGAGVDTLETGPVRDTIDPGSGVDNVNAGGGDDFVYAATAPDGADHYDLGSGVDALSYALRTTPVTVDLEARVGGAAGENDLLLGVERAAGGQAADRLFGSDAESGTGAVAESFYGGGGADVMVGRGGPDLLSAAPLNEGATTLPLTDDPVIMRGGPGSDSLNGLGGDDVARGGRGADSMFLGAGDDRGGGGGGSDTIFGEQGSDQLKGGRDRDRLDAGQEVLGQADNVVDKLNCGPSKKDRAFSVEPNDRVRKCEKVTSEND